MSKLRDKKSGRKQQVTWDNCKYRRTGPTEDFIKELSEEARYLLT